MCVCVCVCLLTQKSEHLRLAAFEIYRSLLAKVRRKVLVFPLKHQVLNLVVPLVLHMEDVNIDVAQVRGSLWGQCSGQSREGLELAHVLGCMGRLWVREPRD